MRSLADTFVDGGGQPVSLTDFNGRYVWIDYAAEWCAACTPQTTAIKSVAATALEKLVFVTSMVTERGGYGHPSTAATAARWAARFDLDPSRVWAGQARLFGVEPRFFRETAVSGNCGLTHCCPINKKKKGLVFSS